MSEDIVVLEKREVIKLLLAAPMGWILSEESIQSKELGLYPASRKRQSLAAVRRQDSYLSGRSLAMTTVSETSRQQLSLPL
jgi:hypothetical protein